MGRKSLLIFSTASVLLTLAGVLWLDRPLAEFIRASGWENARIFSAGTDLLDTASGIKLYKLLPGVALALVGGVLLIAVRMRRHGAVLLFVGVSQMLSTLIGGWSKNLFGRLRPHELLDNGNWERIWFAAGVSFPSGHAAYYFGLFLPLAYLFPRWRLALLVTPFFIAAARVNANMHFFSDVTASMALAALVTLAIAAVLRVEPGRISHG